MIRIVKQIKKKNEYMKNKHVGIAYLNTNIGLIKVCSNEQGITALAFVNEKDESSVADKITEEAIKQLNEYFEGTRKDFDIPVYLEGTEFQLKVWEMLYEVKYGEKASYKDIAGLTGNAKASRAIGGANNKNPVAIILPCHRIVGSNGTLVGYAGGLDKKQWLLEHEMKNK